MKPARGGKNFGTVIYRTERRDAVGLWWLEADDEVIGIAHNDHVANDHSAVASARSRGRGRSAGRVGTSVWTGRALQAGFDDLETIGLALLYPALEWSSIAPGHHGYPRAPDLILGKALEGR